MVVRQLRDRVGVASVQPRGPTPQDDWSSRPPIPAPAAGAARGGGSADDGGLGREPEPSLPEVQDRSAPEPEPEVQAEFDLSLLEDPQALGERMRRAARQAALDPGDGVAL